MTDERTLLLSLKPRFARLILDGTKSIELRRVRPLIRVPTRAVLYASSPMMAIVGTCRVETVLTGPPIELWSAVGVSTGLVRSEFERYFEGAQTAFGLVINDQHELRRPLPLCELRERWPDFVAPQSFRYMSFEEVAATIGVATRETRKPKRSA